MQGEEDHLNCPRIKRSALKNLKSGCTHFQSIQTSKKGGIMRKFVAVVLVLLVVAGCTGRSPHLRSCIISLEQLNDPEGALEQCKRAKELEPNNPEVYLWMGKVYCHSHFRKYLEGTNEFDRALEMDRERTMELMKKDDWRRYPYDLFYYNAGIQAYQKEDYATAEKKVRMAIELAPDSSLYHSFLGSILAYEGKEEEAKREFETALKLNPRNPNVHYNLAVYYKKKKDYKSAAKHLAEAAKLDTANTDYLFELGEVYANLEDYKNAEITFAKITKIDPKNKDAWFNLGVTRVKLEKFKEAARAFEKVVEIDSKDADAYLLLGRVYYRMKEYKKALDALTKCLEIDPSKCEAYGWRGEVYRAMGQKKKAASEFAKEQRCMKSKK
ncbi:hypothetical protein DRQ20_00560 [bacterium]|nr:MAG: hypothetical protein DRQ20_00560 [bacterium]